MIVNCFCVLCRTTCNNRADTKSSDHVVAANLCNTSAMTVKLANNSLPFVAANELIRVFMDFYKYAFNCRATVCSFSWPNIATITSHICSFGTVVKAPT